MDSLENVAKGSFEEVVKLNIAYIYHCIESKSPSEKKNARHFFQREYIHIKEDHNIPYPQNLYRAFERLRSAYERWLK